MLLPDTVLIQSDGQDRDPDRFEDDPIRKNKNGSAVHDPKNKKNGSMIHDPKSKKMDR